MYGTALDLDGWSGGPSLLLNLEIRNAETGVALSGKWGAEVEHLVGNCNLRDCGSALELNGVRARMTGGTVAQGDMPGGNGTISGNDYRLTVQKSAFAGKPLLAVDGRALEATSSLVILRECPQPGEWTTTGPVLVLVDPPVLTVAATDGQAMKGTDDTAQLTVTRTGSLSERLHVTATVTGSAVENVDYTGLPHEFDLAAGAGSASFNVVAGPPKTNGLVSVSTVTLRLVEQPPAYVIEAPTEAGITIKDPSVAGSGIASGTTNNANGALTSLNGARRGMAWEPFGVRIQSLKHAEIRSAKVAEAVQQ